MKNVLILVDKLGEKKEILAKYLSENIPNASVEIATFQDIIYEIEGKKISIKVSRLNKSIDEFDLIYFRRTGSDYSISALTLAICLEYLKIKYFDTTFGNAGPIGSKLTSYIRLSIAGLPTIPSFFCFQSVIDEHKDRIIKSLGLPVVAKELSTQRGVGVFLIKDKEDFAKLPKHSEGGTENQFMFQKFVESNEEYRILVLKETIGAYEQKIRTNPNEFRSNVALGAREEFFDIDKIPEDIKNIAIKGAKTLGIQIAGADVMIDKNGNKWLLEVNRGPGLTYDTKISPELPNLAKFLANELQK